MKKILYGVCGIGNGHTYRQLPILNYLANSHKIMIFAYGDSLTLLSSYFTGHKNIKICEVAVPYYIGNRTGIDFATTARLAQESGVNYTAVNNMALAKAYDYLGKADLVISDYEPICAQYAYAYNIPLLTIDQQSKYLSGEFPLELNGQTYVDEIVRLRMFFPTATARIACSFFNVAERPNTENVQYYPPVLRNELTVIKASAKREHDKMLVYLTTQSGLEQSWLDFVNTLATQTKIAFHVFLPKKLYMQKMTLPQNVRLYQHGDDQFHALLSSCAGIIATAGHGLLSEAMYLGLPVLALPLPLYEQQMNAEIIHKSKFGMSTTLLTARVLESYVKNLPVFAANIKKDTSVLLRGNGQTKIINFIEQILTVHA